MSNAKQHTLSLYIRMRKLILSMYSASSFFTCTHFLSLSIIANVQSCRFDQELQQVVESKPGKMYDLLPAIHFKPAVNHKQAPHTYACPVYKTAVRKGVLSTTVSTICCLPVLHNLTYFH